jgi:hypothetical protein
MKTKDGLIDVGKLFAKVRALSSSRELCAVLLIPRSTNSTLNFLNTSSTSARPMSDWQSGLRTGSKSSWTKPVRFSPRDSFLAVPSLTLNFLPLHVTEAFHLTHLSHLILDVSHLDSKKRSLVDLLEARADLFKLLGSKPIMDRLREGKMKLVVFWSGESVHSICSRLAAIVMEKAETCVDYNKGAMAGVDEFP